MKKKHKKEKCELTDRELLEASLNEGFGVNPVGQQPDLIRKGNRRKRRNNQ